MQVSFNQAIMSLNTKRKNNNTTSFKGEKENEAAKAAMKANDFDTFQKLLPDSAEASPNAILGDAVENGESKYVEALFKAGAEAKDQEECLSKVKNSETVKLFIDNGASKDKLNETLGEADDAKSAKILIECGADVNKLYGWGSEAPLHRLSSNGKIDAMEVVINSGANLNQQSGGSKQTPLFSAALSQQVKAVQLLVDKGADLQIKDYRGETPLEMTKKRLEDRRGYSMDEKEKFKQIVKILEDAEKKQAEAKTATPSTASTPQSESKSATTQTPVKTEVPATTATPAAPQITSSMFEKFLKS